ncbi:nuclear transport factor 2 family protein [Sedimentimonas flavescens]|uniref:Nuclear transport factor 2 family protein n=1 Tax=Sedimentimonas flavescens TaxID=2851012 RepID=A0ABT3A1X7_9RHOB|nr:ketosteroid isomerase-related protein [Sedimentimonas flavescens]MCV2879744.1 nuclear transport factor 2 family protein [Sedimentimonas flavescens]
MPRATALATISAYYDAFNAGDTAGMEALLTEDFEHHVNEGQIRHGIESFRAFNAHMTRCYREHLSDVVVMANDAGTRAAAEFVVNGVYLQSDDGLPEAKGQKYILPAGAFFTLRDGRIQRVTTFYNLADWIRQVS